MGNYKVILLVIFSSALIIFDLNFSYSLQLLDFEENNSIFHLGRYFGGMHFIIFYTFLLLRMMVFNRKRSLKATYYCLTGFWGLTLIAYLIMYFIEGSDSEKSLSFVHGMKSILPSASLIMAYTPFFMPYRVLSGQIFFNQKTGNKDVDLYLEALKENEEIEKEAKEVLILEDDFNGATAIIQFFNRQKIKTYHVTSIPEAMDAFKNYHQKIKLVILENYINAKDSQYKTGLDWARKIDQDHPKGARHFQLITVTGHAHFLDIEENIFDLILQKPLDKKALQTHLMTTNVIK
jgi:CheY-like chemotaxis protein